MPKPNSEKRRKTIRLPGYDYSSTGYYFVTFCSHLRRCEFGEVVGNQMFLSPQGKVIMDLWSSLPEHFLNVSLDYMQVMPNHVHAIVSLDEESRTETKDPKPFPGRPTIGQVIGYWKYQTAKAINRERGKVLPVWQENMYEHIIRNQQELQRIRQYIVNNPAKWAEDIENPVNMEKIAAMEREKVARAALLKAIELR